MPVHSTSLGIRHAVSGARPAAHGGRSAAARRPVAASRTWASIGCSRHQGHAATSSPKGGARGALDASGQGVVALLNTGLCGAPTSAAGEVCDAGLAGQSGDASLAVVGLGVMEHSEPRSVRDSLRDYFASCPWITRLREICAIPPTPLSTLYSSPTDNFRGKGANRA
jgi:hypothetical protein